MLDDNNEVYEGLNAVLRDCGIYNPADDMTIRLLADTILLYKKVRTDLKDYPSVMEMQTAQGKSIKVNPGIKAVVEINDRIRYLLTELQLTAKSRKDKDIGTKSPAQAVNDFISGVK